MKIAFLHQEGMHYRTTAENYQTVDRIVKSVETYEPDLFLGPEYLFVGTNGAMEQDKKTDLVQRLREGTKDKKTILFPGTIVWTHEGKYKNTCPVIHKGELLKEVNKISRVVSDRKFIRDDCSMSASKLFDRASNLALQQYLENHVVDINGQRYFVEICADHYQEKEKDIFQVSKFADYQIILSYSQLHHFNYSKRQFLRDGGLLMECNGLWESSHVGLSDSEKIDKLYSSRHATYDCVVLVDVLDVEKQDLVPVELTEFSRDDA